MLIWALDSILQKGMESFYLKAFDNLKFYNKR